MKSNKKLTILRVFACIISVSVLLSLVLRFVYWNYFTENFDTSSAFIGVKSYSQMFYFTTISNILVSVYLILFAIKPNLKIVNSTLVQIALVCYILITMLVYFVGTFISESWFVGYFLFDFTNVLLHIISPISYFIIFTFLNNRDEINYTRALYLLAFPVIYAVLITLYSNMTGWFPYSFLDGARLAKIFHIGYTSVVVPALIVVCTCIVILLVCLFVVFNIVFVSNLQCKKRAHKTKNTSETQYH